MLTRHASVHELSAEVLAAQQCADRGLLKVIFVSSDDAFISHMLGKHVVRHVSTVCLPCLPLSVTLCLLCCASWTLQVMSGGLQCCLAGLLQGRLLEATETRCRALSY